MNRPSSLGVDLVVMCRRVLCPFAVRLGEGATVGDPAANSDLGSVRIDATYAGYRRLLA